jgi:hypothetical protein
MVSCTTAATSISSTRQHGQISSGSTHHGCSQWAEIHLCSSDRRPCFMANAHLAEMLHSLGGVNSRPYRQTRFMTSNNRRDAAASYVMQDTSIGKAYNPSQR